MKKEIKIRQYDRYDCASACVASVCAYYGLRLPLLRIREACGTTQDGTTLQGIIDACGKLGLDAVGLQAKEKRLLDLRDAAKPVIMHLKKKNGWLHYVVLYGMDADRAEVMDPEDGRMHRIPLQELEEEWSGFIVAASPSPMFRKGDHSTPVAARFRELFLHYKKELLLVLTGSAAFIAATLSTSVFLQKVIDDILDVTADTAVLGKTAGKDAAEDKPTYVSLLGLDQSRTMAQNEINKALEALGQIELLSEDYQGKTQRLAEIARYILSRDH